MLINGLSFRIIHIARDKGNCDEGQENRLICPPSPFSMPQFGVGIGEQQFKTWERVSDSLSIPQVTPKQRQGEIVDSDSTTLK